MDERQSSKRKILIVDDSELNRSLLYDILCDDFDILEARDGLEASVILRDREYEISLMLLDIVMPVMDGFELLEVMHKNNWIKSIPVIMISAENTPAYVDKAYDLGVWDYINRPFDERVVQRRVNSAMIVAAKQQELTQMVTSQMYEKEKNNRLMIEILSNIVEFRNGESGLHVLHLHTLTSLFLKQLLKKTNKYDFTKKDIPLICNASALHDIGKIAIPESILNKPGRLTDEEFEIMKTHSAEGAKLLSNLPHRQNEPLIKVAYQICRWHHERYDGRGYPDGIKGDDIPVTAQVVALADVYDALTSKRAYKDAFSHERAVEMIINGECGAFNPILLECLSDLSDTLKSELNAVTVASGSEMEILDTVEQMMEQSDVRISERTFKMLDNIRMKYKFLADLSHEINFEYTAMPELITIPRWSAEYLSVPEVISCPRESALANDVFGRETFDGLLDRLENTSQEEPVIEEICDIRIRDKVQSVKASARSIWDADEDGSVEYKGAIVKLTGIGR